MRDRLRRLKLPSGSALVAFILSGIASYLAKLSLLPFLVIILSLPVAIATVTFAVVWLKGKFADIDFKLQELEFNINTIGAIGHVLALKKEITEITRIREVLIDTDPEGRDVSITRQVLTRAQPGDPLDRFPVLISTDRMDLSFEDLNYEILTPETAELENYERLIIEGRLTKFVIHNRLKEAVGV